MTNPTTLTGQEPCRRNKNGLFQKMAYDVSTGCWNWIGTKVAKGYGKTSWQGKSIYVHRLAAMLWMRFDPRSPLFVLHKCDNPACFNPKHLFVGTHLENMKDQREKGRHLHKFCKNGHAFDSGNVIKECGSVRRCKICRTLWRIQNG